jgi:putative transposase
MAILRRDYPYLLHQLNIIRLNKVWGVDIINYLRMKKEIMYLFVIIDWYSRLYICLIL